jgi:hypothetical protein
VVGAAVLETLVGNKGEEETSTEADDILVEALVRNTLANKEEEASMEEGENWGDRGRYSSKGLPTKNASTKQQGSKKMDKSTKNAVSSLSRGNQMLAS